MNQQRIEIAFVTPLQIMKISEPATLYARLTVMFEGFAITSQGERVMFNLPVDHAVKMQVSYVDAAGNPAAVDGDVAWSSSDEAIATLLLDNDDSTVCVVQPRGKLGQVQITASADADLGQGVRPLLTIADITIVAGEAVAGTISPVGVPTPIEPTPRA